MSFHWSCFIVPSCFEICSFIAILVCLSLFHSVYAHKQKKKKQQQQQQKKKNNNNNKKKKKNKRKKKKENINNCARICIQYKYSLSSYVDL